VDFTQVVAMPERGFLTIAQQVAAHLRKQIGSGRWTAKVPGRHEVARELGISDQTAETALAQLEKEGLLESQGAGRRRRIKLAPGESVPGSSLRVAILVGELADQRRHYLVEIKHELAEAGHSAFFTPWFMPELGMNVASIAGRLKRTEADAWIVLSAARPLLAWFVEQELPVFALFGRRRGLPVAGVGPDKPPAIAKATRRLIELGHRRIALLALRAQRLPQPGASVQPFLNELAAHGLEPGPYNLPDWAEDIDSFHGCLESLFRHTPPTALIVDEAAFFFATMQFLLNRCLRVPADVSLICTDPDSYFNWCRPSIAHVSWDTAPVVRRALRWANNLAHGKRDVRQTLTRAGFVEGGTIGPAAAGK
jgi:DNA-binding LacI/PurR family transcriptional regulator